MAINGNMEKEEPTRPRVTVNCDMGEAYGSWKMGPDEKFMPLIDIANVACSFHGGDPVVMHKTIKLAKKHGVLIGAHPSVPDREGFGRRYIDLSPENLFGQLVYQIGALTGMLRAEDMPLNHVKTHGCLWRMCEASEAHCSAVLYAIEVFDHLVNAVGVVGGLPLYGPVDPRHQLVVPKYNPARTWTRAGCLGSGGTTGSIYPTCCGVSPEEFDDILQKLALGMYEIRIEPGGFDLATYDRLVTDTADEVAAMRMVQVRCTQAEPEKENQLYAEWVTAKKEEEEAGRNSLASTTTTDPNHVLVASQMIASVWKVSVAIGDIVRSGTVLVILEAMKMEIAMRARRPQRRSGGFGSKDEEALEASIVHALKSGYRLIDTAQFYQVEAIVGRAIKASGVPREKITVVTKFWGYWHHDPAAALEISLRDLGLDYIDVFLMHWPAAMTPLPEAKTVLPTEIPTTVETWKKMEALVGNKCHTIGVSNFTQKTLATLLESATIVPAVNQVELHALNPNLALVPWCIEHGIQVVSWSTLGPKAGPENPILHHPIFTDIAAAHNVGAAVVSLSWAVQRGVAIIPKSATASRIEANIRLVELSPAEMASIDGAHKKLGPLRLTDSSVNLAVTVNGKRTILGWSNVEMGWEDEEGNWLV
ncbi:hypothetical protein Sste5344_005461 [Sporothrix stenoceras]